MMESWNEIVNTALLGTDKRQLNEAELPEGLKQYVNVVREELKDREDQFLGIASLVFNFRQCGVVPVNKKELPVNKAEPEELEYASVSAHYLLHEIITEDSPVLLSIWLQLCSYSHNIVLPETLPFLFETGLSQKHLRQLILKCVGKRGEWLAKFNESWQFEVALPDEDVWQTGTLEQRKTVLQNTRKNDAGKGRALLQAVWSQENAATKAELLKQLHTGLSDDDLPWLEQLLSEKSEEVKETAAALLQKLSSSSIVQSYLQVLQQSIKVREGRTILGIGGKRSLILELPELYDDRIFKWGLEKLSNQKGVSDNELIIYQLVERVPPHFWEQWLQLNVDEIVQLFRNEPNKRYLKALGAAASRFKNEDWLRAIIKSDEKTLYSSVFSILPKEEKEAYALSFLDSEENAQEVIEQLTTFCSSEWSLEITKAVFLFSAKRPYQYNHTFYNKHVHLFPPGIIQYLEACTPPEEYNKNYWRKTSEYITRLLTLKQQTITAFNKQNQ